MIRQVAVLGILVPEEIRWIAARTKVAWIRSSSARVRR
jgi:hypothetical protein